MFLQISHSFSQISIFNFYTLFQRVKMFEEKDMSRESTSTQNAEAIALQHTMTIFQKLI